MEKEEPAVKSLNLIRGRLCNPSFVFRSLSGSPDGNYSKLKFIISSSVSEGCNNTILLLGPRGSGKAAIRLNGLLHSDDNCAFKEIARQLCTEHHLLFSKMASFDENLQFMIAMLRECGLAHKTIIFVLDEFDMFAQGKQRLLYSLLDAMQSVTSQAVVVGISSRLDADQLLEKRVRSRFSNRKLLFLPPSKEELDSLLVHLLSLHTDSSFSNEYVTQFNERIKKITADARFKDILETFFNANSTVNSLLKLLFSAVSSMDLNSGLLSLENFKSALSIMQRQTKLEAVRDCSVLELYILVCMKRLEAKEQSSYNFNSVMKEYKAIHDSFQTSDYYARTVCLRAFEHLLQRELICYADNRGQAQTVEYRPANLLISAFELHHGMRSHKCCPAILLKLLDHL
ncbi:PREDICTED: origin of replication complex subunit 4 isoform X2 [Tarenaya hassleriana]|uniref:origin of replication complex subunit 4 isoform X2 n=1 Tax=Tarenaya hassleriana TaxID=28532 RepID=UPI00053C9F28|nr:PREDICTED: origin of replication complex subunit 4 isoform X2 [Tarenaya hassleriana]